jgi:hypothetical protein
LVHAAEVKRFLREPLVHFLVLGAGLFVAYGLMSKPGRGNAPQAIVVTAGQIEHLTANFEKTWLRPPSDAELKGLIDDWVRDEIATREAMALGLDKDDSVIRRRLRQKLEFVSDDIAAQTAPTDADLDAYLHAHPELFRIEPESTFSQVVLDPGKHGESLARDAARLLARLNQDGGKADLAALSDSSLLEPTFRSVTTAEIATQFGGEFAAKLGGLPIGTWQGPITSGYGAHLVLVRERSEGRLPELADVRERVSREWENARRLEGAQKFYDELAKRYTVIIERPEAK